MNRGRRAFKARWVAVAVVLLAVVVFPVSASALGTYDKRVHTSAETVGAPIRSTHNLVYGNESYGGTPGWTGLTCATCHRGDLGAIHADNCDTCHAGANPRASFTTWNKSCQQGACHPGTKAYTVTVSGKSTVKYAFDHPLLGSTKAHTTTSPLKIACADCHRPGVTVKTTCTARCHGANATHTPRVTTPTTLVSVHGLPYGAEYVAAGSFRGLTCTQCHSGDLGSVHGDTCTACHYGTNPPRKSFTTWNKSCQQGACHPSTAITYNGKQVTAFAHPNLTQSTHKDAGVACASCHVAGIRYENLCLVCHANNADPNTSHTPSASAGAAILGNHGAAPYGAPYTAAGGWTPACSGCHDGDLKAIHVTKGCATCHGTPNGDPTLTPVRNTITGAWNGSCQQGACHPGTQITYNGAAVTVFKHKNSTTTSHKDRGATCADCHYAGADYRTFCFKCHS